jgi:hypothetical protein
MAESKKELLRNENDYVLNYLQLVDWKGNRHNFTAHFIEFSYEESIFETFLHGCLIASDAVDYPTLLPMIGEERVRASFTRPNEKVPAGSDGELLPPIEFDMPVYLMDGKRQEAGSGKFQVYNLFYTSDEIFNNLNNKVFKAFKDLKYSEMVKKLYDSHLKKSKELFIGDDETTESVDYLVQNELPVRAISKIAKRCISKKNRDFFFVFYEDRDRFNFVSIGYLIKQEPIATFTYEIKNIMENGTGLSPKLRDLEKDMGNVSNYQQQGTYDVLGAALSGENTSSMLSVDPILRKYSVKEFDLRKEYDNFPHMEKSKPWSENNKMFVNSKTNMAMVVSDSEHSNHEYISGREPNVRSAKPEEFLLHRQSQKRQLLKNVISIELSGDPRIKAGTMIKFNIPEHLGKTGDQNPEQKDQYLQGKYLVVAVAHIIKYGKYLMVLELLRDTFYSDIEYRDPVKEYENIF